MEQGGSYPALFDYLDETTIWGCIIFRMSGGSWYLLPADDVVGCRTCSGTRPTPELLRLGCGICYPLMMLSGAARAAEPDLRPNSSVKYGEEVGMRG